MDKKRSIDPLTYLEKGTTALDVAKQLEQFSNDCRLFSLFYPALQWLVPNSWIAIYKGHVIGNDEDLQRLLFRLAWRGYPRTSLAIRFIYPVGSEPTLILRAAA